MTPEEVYNFQMNDLVIDYTPNKLKKPRFINWITALCKPFSFLYIAFLNYRKAKLYELSITPQVALLEKLLNDRYDFANRGIYIEDGKDFSPLFIFKRAELKPVYISRRIEDKPKALYTRGESGLLKDDFVVYVPMAVVFDMAEMGGLIRKYKLGGTKFKIQRI